LIFNFSMGFQMNMEFCMLHIDGQHEQCEQYKNILQIFF
jgi:hypothetical protein